MNQPVKETLSKSNLSILAGAACLSELTYLAIFFSSQSLHEAGTGAHSLLTLLALFCTAFVLYVFSIPLAVQESRSPQLLWLIWGFGTMFRVTLLLSDPIEEIDLYRYLWDGTVLTQRISPYRYSPYQVLSADANSALPDDLARLVHARDSSPEMITILKCIHFGELPTIYPPVSQVIFAIVALVTPPESSLYVRMTLMKAAFVLFDLATLYLVITLLRFAGRPVGWSISYAWCPLLIKEIANSGHLDSLAFFFATLSLSLAASALFGSQQLAKKMRHSLAASAFLALACGAKLYPVILLPLCFFGFQRKFGVRQTFLAAFVFLAALIPLAWPMIPNSKQMSQKPWAMRFTTDPPTQESTDAPPIPPPDIDLEPRDPSESLRAFLSDWEMNDFVFLILIENIRSTDEFPPTDRAWFSFASDSWRAIALKFSQQAFHTSPESAAFLLTRVILSIVFVLLALGIAWKASNAERPADWLSAAFVTVAWFWLFLPTLNPWYWTWALPLLPFARNRAWVAVSGLGFAYYFRFWLAQHFSHSPICGTTYNGPLFFDYVVTWIEFGPWFIALLSFWICDVRRSSLKAGENRDAK